jgi:ATP-dependent Zn protease
MNATTRHSTAAWATAHAVLNDVLGAGAVLTISVVPTTKALGFVHFDPKPALLTTTEMENRITVAVACLAASELTGDATSGDASSLRCANDLAENLATMQDNTWRQSQPELADSILRRCVARATALVAEHKERILKLTAILADKSTLSGAELAAI